MLLRRKLLRYFLANQSIEKFRKATLWTKIKKFLNLKVTKKWQSSGILIVLPITGIKQSLPNLKLQIMCVAVIWFRSIVNSSDVCSELRAPEV